MPIYTLAKYTVRGYLRERVLLIVLVFAAVLMAFSYVLSPLAVGAQQKIVIDIGLAAISIFAVILIVLLGAGSYHQEKERGILKALLVKPITRADFLLGKYLGTVLTAAMVVILMSCVHVVVMLVSGAPITENFFWAVYLTIAEAALVTAVLTFFASFTSPILGSFFTISVVVAGHLSTDLLAFADRFDAMVPKLVATVAYYVLPNLGLFNVRSEAVHNLPLPEGFIYSVTLYGFFYVGSLLLASNLIFRTREID